MKKALILANCMFAPLLSVSALAKISVQDASQLSGDLTGVGAEKAGNSEGTIPAFSGQLPFFPKQVYSSPGKHLPNPYADEKPVLVLTVENFNFVCASDLAARLAWHPVQKQ
ncbi:MAG: hypothetical protein HRU20_03960 [Pseudomonadales bacterium]|nr:hypothetical protein [Pseudomonadales bacterium]